MEAASAVAFVGAAGTAGLGALKGFQGLDGQWKGTSVTSVAEATSADADGLEAVVSSSEDASLAEALVGGGEVDREALNIRFLRGDQPGGRRLVNNWRKQYSVWG